MKQKMVQPKINVSLLYGGIIVLVSFFIVYTVFQLVGMRNYQSTNTQGNGIRTVDELMRTESSMETPLSEEAKNALEEAIMDEYKALSTYQAVLDKFGSVRPFSMIIRAEEQHIALLKAVFETYKLPIPKNTWLGTIVAPSTLKSACQTGVDAEIANVQLYKTQLLPAVAEYSDITSVFENLMNASELNHLPAFEKCN